MEIGQILMILLGIIILIMIVVLALYLKQGGVRDVTQINQLLNNSLNALT